MLQLCVSVETWGDGPRGLTRSSSRGRRFLAKIRVSSRSRLFPFVSSVTPTFHPSSSVSNSPPNTSPPPSHIPPLEPPLTGSVLLRSIPQSLEIISLDTLRGKRRGGPGTPRGDSDGRSSESCEHVGDGVVVISYGDEEGRDEGDMEMTLSSAGATNAWREISRDPRCESGNFEGILREFWES
jgi:hypothetical protein